MTATRRLTAPRTSRPASRLAGAAASTPGPWSAARSQLNDLWTVYAGKDTRKSLAAVHDPYGFDMHVAEANAELIVRAVNAHDDMLAALRVAAETLMSFDGGNPKDETGWQHDELREAWVVVTDAIRKAEILK